MNSEEIGSKVKEMLSKGAKASKDAFEKAGDKVQNFTDKSVIKLEIHQLETKRDCKYEEIGLKISQMLLDGAKITNISDDEVKILEGLQEEINNLSEQICQKESELK